MNTVPRGRCEEIPPHLPEAGALKPKPMPLTGISSAATHDQAGVSCRCRFEFRVHDVVADVRLLTNSGVETIPVTSKSGRHIPQVLSLNCALEGVVVIHGLGTRVLTTTLGNCRTHEKKTIRSRAALTRK